jgi:ubiquinone/menaquinone biosynthesis C-methylase UbiE
MADATEFLPGAGFHFLTPIYELLARPMLGGVWRDVVRDVNSFAHPVASIVDLGCGPGTVLRQLARRRSDLSLTGVDIDQRMLSIARRRLPRARLLQGSIDEVPIEDKSADMVISSMVFHHLKRQVKQGAFREAMRILKPRGSVSPLRLFGASEQARSVDCSLVRKDGNWRRPTRSGRAIGNRGIRISDYDAPLDPSRLHHAARDQRGQVR